MLPNICIFDLDGTLYDYEIANSKATQDMIGFISSRTDIPAKKMETLYQKARLDSKQHSNLTAESHNIILYLVNLFHKKELDLSLEKIVESENVYWSSFISNIEIFENLEEFLLDLKSYGVKLILVTDMSAKIQIRKLIALNLDKVFDIFLSSDQVGGDKKTGKPFIYLSEEIQNQNKWYIGDKDWDFNFTDTDESVERFMKVPNLNVMTSNDSPLRHFVNYQDLRSFLKKCI